METNDDSKYSLGKCLEAGLKFLAAHHIPPEVLLWPLAAAVLYFEKTSCLNSSESDLKERKKRGEKKKSPRTPLIKEKQPEKIEKENIYANLGLKADLEERREAFRQECLRLVTKDNEQRVADFFHYYSQSSKRGRMVFERKKYWDTEKRLKLWMNRSYNVDNTAAALRLERLKKREQGVSSVSERDRKLAAEREEANARLDREIEERKKGAVSHEEFLAMKKNEE